ncbi:MAG: pyrroline-5-carboxylate reductase [Acutalibacteraceae bacterium]
MSEVKFGFIGTGNMGAALARALRKTVPGHEVVLSDRTAQKAQTLAAELNCRAADNKTVARDAKFIFLGVKPQMMQDMLDGIKETLSARTDRFVLVTMAAGIQIETINEMLAAKYPVIRIMPNTPVAIGEGVVLYSASEDVFMDEITDFSNCMRNVGILDRLDEHLIDAACAVSGCGPAFVYMFAQALADGAVECGLPRDKAARYAAQTLIGSARLILESEKHPEQLKDEVCSPGGTTIAGVHALENDGFRGAVMDAVKAAFDKTKKL